MKAFRHRRIRAVALVAAILVSLAPLALPACAAIVSPWSSMSSGTTEPLGSVWGSSSSDVFAVGNSGTILRYNAAAPGAP